jgi:hypothetical protein
MKRTLVIISILTAFFSSRISAALGDDEQQIEKLFGTPVKEGVPDKRGITTKVYGKGKYAILVQFLNHLSLAESYARTDQVALSQPEIDAFLEGSSNGRPWTKDPNKPAWERADHKAKAWVATVREQSTLLIEAE